MLSAAFIPSFSWLMLLAITNLLVIVGCIAVGQFRSRRQQRQVQQLNAAIHDYFRHGGIEVNVACVRLDKSPGFIAFVESEPMKRFRLSHIIEISLREQIAKTSGIHLNKIYWRFPLKEMAPSTTIPAKPSVKEADSYINEGLVYYHQLPKGDVEEVSWENFEESAAMDLAANSEPIPPAQTR